MYISCVTDISLLLCNGNKFVYLLYNRYKFRYLLSNRYKFKYLFCNRYKFKYLFCNRYKFVLYLLCNRYKFIYLLCYRYKFVSNFVQQIRAEADEATVFRDVQEVLNSFEKLKSSRIIFVIG